MTTIPATPVTASDLANALRGATEALSVIGIEWGLDDTVEEDTARWVNLLEDYDAQVPIDPATNHVKEYDPDAWHQATHAAALHFWGMEYYEHDPARLMEAVSAALYFLAPAIVRQERERQADALRGGE